VAGDEVRGTRSRRIPRFFGPSWLFSSNNLVEMPLCRLLAYDISRKPNASKRLKRITESKAKLPNYIHDKSDRFA